MLRFLGVGRRSVSKVEPISRLTIGGVLQGDRAMGGKLKTHTPRFLRHFYVAGGGAYSVESNSTLRTGWLLQE